METDTDQEEDLDFMGYMREVKGAFIDLWEEWRWFVCTRCFVAYIFAVFIAQAIANYVVYIELASKVPLRKVGGSVSKNSSK